MPRNYNFSTNSIKDLSNHNKFLFGNIVNIGEKILYFMGGI